MSLRESFDQLTQGFERRAGLPPAVAKGSAIVFFIIVGGALAYAVGIGIVLSLGRTPQSSGADLRPFGLLLVAAIVMSVAVASLGRRLSTIPAWLKAALAIGCLGAALLGVAFQMPVAALVLLLATAGITIAYGYGRRSG